ncbi:mCG1046443, partial [Mus musculus]
SVCCKVDVSLSERPQGEGQPQIDTKQFCVLFPWMQTVHVE